MDNFLAELKRRNIYRVGAAYAVVAWVLLQLVGVLMPVFDLPVWIARAFLLFLAIGFPVALVFAWVHQLAPESGALARVTTGKLDWALMGALVVVIALVSYQQLAPSPGARTAQDQQAGVAAARAASTAKAGAISIAVLPFANLSGDAAQEFFSDGMTEEITAALAKIPDLRVVARTSAFQFKAQNRDIQSIGQQLHATHFIEGSVRKAGTRVRITAQLIKADDGTHIWTENYDRELTDVFAIQEDIATAIAGALRMPLGLKPGERLVSSRTADAESYQQYLRARALVRARALPDAIAILEPVVARDPNYAPAWALLAQAYDLTPNQYATRFGDSIEGLRRVVDASLPRAETAARRAIQLDANLADGYVSLARVQDRHGKFLLAEELYSKALALDPNNPEALHAYSLLLAAVGRIKEALAMRQRLQALEPFVPNYNFNTVLVLWLDGQTDAAIAMAKTLPAAFSPMSLAMIYAAAGRYSQAADALLETQPGSTDTAVQLQIAARLLRMAPAPARSPANLPRLGVLGYIYLYVGAPSRTLEYPEGELEAGYLSKATNAQFWHPSYAPVRKTERFKTFVRKAGFVEYWRAKGWPEFCHPTTADDFICD